MKSARVLATALVPLMVLAPVGPAHHMAGVTFGPARAGAQALPQSPNDPVFQQMWVNPQARPGEHLADLDAELTEVSGGGVITAGERVRMRLTITAATDQSVTVTPRVAGPVTDVAEGRLALAGDLGQFIAHSSGEQVRAGAGRPIEVTVELPELNPGLYPVAVAIAGARGITSQRFLLHVAPQNPASAAAAREQAAPDAQPHAEGLRAGVSSAAVGNWGLPTTGEPAALGAVVPITQQVNTVPGETGEAPEAAPLILEDESLAESMGPDGRLGRLLGALEARGGHGTGARDQAEAPGRPAATGAADDGDGVCLAIDPALVSAAERMAAGYTVASSRVSQAQEHKRLRDSWTADKNPTGATPGAGSEVAAQWLHRLTALSTGCVVALPWANADLEAVARTGDPWLMQEAVTRGPDVLKRVLGVETLPGVVVPGGGFVTAGTAQALTTAYRSASAGDGDGPHHAQTGPGAGGATDDAAETAGNHSGIEARWERSRQTAGKTAPGAGAPGGEPHQKPLHILVADNTVWGAGDSGPVADLGPGTQAVTMPGSLATTLAALSQDPVTTAYSNPASRFDYRLDAPAARLASARAAILAEAEGEGPVLMTLPALVDPEALAGVLELVDAAPHSSVAKLLTPSQRTFEAPAHPGADPAADGARTADETAVAETGLPFVDDPGGYADTEVQRAAQQSEYTDALTRILDNDPSIALTRYEFTAPLRRDVLAALTTTGRRQLATFDAAVAHTSARIDGSRAMLQSLRSAIELVPPGNVYTRSSESSPLLIVARNGLPLPATARIEYESAPGARLNTPNELRIPARGSITVEMTANLPNQPRQTDLSLWLATLDGARISDRVEITVQTRTTLVAGLVGAVAGIGILVLLGLVRGARKRHTSFR
ncbi:hypothetical protein [Corynebacterium atypicum]|uniref:hypothetical protein n=1 Tax=Corynebacterium atypicum TaxID=191610 RepID=UPI00068B8C61|nr:hypothetical protein [Corynebacterium atypicum]